LPSCLFFELNNKKDEKTSKHQSIRRCGMLERFEDIGKKLCAFDFVVKMCNLINIKSVRNKMALGWIAEGDVCVIFTNCIRFIKITVTKQSRLSAYLFKLFVKEIVINCEISFLVAADPSTLIACCCLLSRKISSFCHLVSRYSSTLSYAHFKLDFHLESGRKRWWIASANENSFACLLQDGKYQVLLHELLLRIWVK